MDLAKKLCPIPQSSSHLSPLEIFLKGILKERLHEPMSSTFLQYNQDIKS